MIIYTYKLDNYIRKVILPKLLLQPNRYTIKGSFRRKIPYITDVDVVNEVYPEIDQDNIYDEILKLLRRIENEPDIILIYISCGLDDRFLLKTGTDEELAEIRKLLKPQDIQEFDSVLENYRNNNERKFFYISEIIWKYYKLRWNKEEVIQNRMILPGNTVIKFTDAIKQNCTMLLQYYVKLSGIPVGIDVVINYMPINMSTAYKAAADYNLKLANYGREYYYMLFPFRYYFRTNRKLVAELEDLIEKKFGLNKQLMVRIDTYHTLYDTKNLDIETAKRIIVSIISDVKQLSEPFRSYTSAIINKLSEVASDNQPQTKMEQWNLLLTDLYKIINQTTNQEAKDYFFEYLDMLPDNIKSKYYLANMYRMR